MNNIDRLPVTARQVEALTIIQCVNDIPFGVMSSIMFKQGILRGHIPRDIEQFINLIIDSGVIAYNRFRDLLQHFDIPAHELNHPPERYQWVWVSHCDGRIIKQSEHIYTDYEQCLKKGNLKRPLDVAFACNVL